MLKSPLLLVGLMLISLAIKLLAEPDDPSLWATRGRSIFPFS